MGAEEMVGRRDFLKKIPLFGAGLALGLSALADVGETPKARKLAGGDIVEPEATCSTGSCNVGDVWYGCNTGDASTDPPTCNSGTKGTICNTGTCNVGE